jgi:hypothetical protein
VPPSELRESLVLLLAILAIVAAVGLAAVGIAAALGAGDGVSSGMVSPHGVTTAGTLAG